VLTLALFTAALLPRPAAPAANDDDDDG